MSPCLTLSIIRYGSRVKWRNPGKGVAPFPTPWCSSYRKGSLRVTLDYGQIYNIWELISLLRTFVLILVGFFFVFVLFFSLRFGQISPLAFFRWLTATSDRNAESCNRIPSNYCLIWLLSIAPRKQQQKKKKLPRWGQKSVIKKLILRLRSLISKGFPMKTTTTSVPK